MRKIRTIEHILLGKMATYMEKHKAKLLPNTTYDYKLQMDF